MKSKDKPIVFQTSWIVYDQTGSQPKSLIQTAELIPPFPPGIQQLVTSDANAGCSNCQAKNDCQPTEATLSDLSGRLTIHSQLSTVDLKNRCELPKRRAIIRGQLQRT